MGGVGGGAGGLSGVPRGGSSVYIDPSGGAHARDDDLLMHQHQHPHQQQQARHGGVGSGVVGMGVSRANNMHEEPLQRSHNVVPGGRGVSGVSARSPALGGGTPVMTRARSLSHQVRIAPGNIH